MARRRAGGEFSYERFRDGGVREIISGFVGY